MGLFIQETTSHVCAIDLIATLIIKAKYWVIFLLGCDPHAIVLSIPKKEVEFILSLNDALQRVLANFSGEIFFHSHAYKCIGPPNAPAI